MPKLSWIAALVILISLPLAASAQQEVVTTTMDGVVPGTTINFTITATGMAREIWAPAASDMNTWNWENGFPEFVGISTQTLTVDFSAPVEINRLVLGVNSFFNPMTLTVSGGTAATADFDLADGIGSVGGTAPANYDGATGVFTTTGGDQSLMIGSTSTNTITQLSITGDNGGDGYTFFFGTTVPTAPPIVDVPINDTTALLLMWLLLTAGALWLMRHS